MIDYVGLILFALVLIEMLITKEAGFLGMNVKKKGFPKGLLCLCFSAYFGNDFFSSKNFWCF